ncbi:MAG: hypothetical protein K2P66_01540 [Lachnospiraceae bacterium]|nr:hypothetical protein [Lachnospiraceae bacterium]
MIREVMPGKGMLDLKLVMQSAKRLGRDMTVYAEHLKDAGEYAEAVRYLRHVGEAD